MILSRLQLPRAAVLAAIVAGALAIAGVAFLVWPPGRASGIPDIGGPFALLDGDGHTVTDRDLRGRFALIYFGYTFCPDVCPTTLNGVATALQSLGQDADRLRAVFITIDPQRDTPAVVRSYAAAFSPRIMGLTGSPEAIAAVARAYRVYYAPHRTGPGPQDYTMDHSSVLYLIGPDGEFRSVLPADGPPADLTTALRKAIS